MSSLDTGSSTNRFKVSEGNLNLLQEYVRKDPDSYLEEYGEQLQHFFQTVKLLEIQPKIHRMSVEQVAEVVNFLASVSYCYPDRAKLFGKSLIEILTNKASDLDSELRMIFCRAVLSLQKGNNLTSVQILTLFFELVKCEDKKLRKFILNAILSMIKNVKPNSKNTKRNKKNRNKKMAFSINRTNSLTPAATKIQALVFVQLQDSRSICARIAQMVLVEAYRKGYWRDSKTANVLAECVFHKVRRIQVSTIKFFLGSVEDEEGLQGDSDSESEANNRQGQLESLRTEVASSLKYAKKSRKKVKDLEKVKKALGKEQKSKKESRSKFCNLEALRAIYDPQKFTDRLFASLESKKNEKFVLKLLQIALCARMIGIHQLQTLGFYSYLQRYLRPKQNEITRILLYAAQACHELVPPDLVEGLVRAIAQNFVSDQNSAEAITVGLNTIREIFANCPAAANEDLLRDLALYKSYRNKNVSMAARGLITLFRSVNPKLLQQKDRGRVGANNLKESADFASKLQYGSVKVNEFVPGAEILTEEAMEEDEAIGSDLDTDDEEGWMDVESSEEENENDEEENATQQTIENENSENENEWESDDEEEENDESEWEDMEEGVEIESNDYNSNKQENNESKKLTKTQKKKVKEMEKKADKRINLEKAKLISESRILTDTDFKKIRAHHIRQQIAAGRKIEKMSGRKRTNDDLLLEEEVQEKIARREHGDGLPRLNDIENFHKKIYKQNKSERLEQAAVSREEKDEFGKPKKRGSHVGRTNREMAKNKTYQMVKQKVRGKNRQRSFRDRQMTLRKYLLRQSGKKVV